MLKYKTYRFASIADGAEDLNDMLAGMSGKNRKIVLVGGEKTDLQYIRIYRDGEQFVNLISDFLTAAHPLLTVDIPLGEGQLCKVGYWNNTGGPVTDQDIVVGYEES